MKETGSEIESDVRAASPGKLKESLKLEKENFPFILEPWVVDILSNPITKRPAKIQEFEFVGGIVDARVYLKSTIGFKGWKSGQAVYEKAETFNHGTAQPIKDYQAEIKNDRPVYEHFILQGRILDVGGGVGTVREFLPEQIQFVSVDPYISAPFEIPWAKKEAYSCLNKPLNFIGACAEFLPFIENQFDWVHMRSMLDHVQIPDLAMLEARRVLRKNGNLLVGLYVEGGKTGEIILKRKIKNSVRDVLARLRIQEMERLSYLASNLQKFGHIDRKQ